MRAGPLGLALLSIVASGCASGTRPIDGTCSSDLECPRARCVDGRCVARPDLDAAGPSQDDAGSLDDDAGPPAPPDAGPACAHASECEDLDACTMDECAFGRCVHTAISCDDGNACTSDSCDPAGGCASAPISCDDGNACTTDACDPATGCTHVPVAPPSGTCAAPIDVSAGGTFTGDSTCAASAYSGVCSGATGGDVTFVLDVAARSTVALDASASSFTPVLFLGSACGSEASGCDASGAARVTAELMPGRYYVGLDGRASSDVGPWSLTVTVTPVIVDETVTFPRTGDPRAIVSAPYMWHGGDFIQGTRTTSLPSITRAEMTLQLSYNGLTCDTQDTRLSINGVQVGTFSIAPGATTVAQTFTFPALSGPTYTLRLETISTVASGCGAAALADDVSTFRLVR